MNDCRAVVRTVNGDIAPDDVGPTLLHEHVISSVLCYWEPEVAPEIAAVSVNLETLAQVRRHPFAVRSNLVLDDVERAADELRRFATAGGRTIVDATSHGLGRDVRALRLVAELAGVAVVAGCGYYLRASHPPGVGERTERSMADEMVREIESGIDGTAVRSGVIGEIGVGTYPMDGVERRVLRAAARAQLETGAGLIVHPAPGDRSAFEVARVLASAGARMDKVLMSHLDERFRSSLGLFRRLARYDCLLGLDTFGREMYWAGRKRQHPSDSDRIRTVVGLLEMGLGDRIVLAQDICLRHELASLGGHGYGHVLANIVPRLRDAGVLEASIDRMLVTTPTAFLTLSTTHGCPGTEGLTG